MNTFEAVSAIEERPSALGQASRHNSQDSQDWWLRLGTLTVLTLALGLIWWSFTRVLAPRQKQAREMSSTVAHLSAHLDDLDRKWNRANTEDIKQKFDALPAELFEGATGLEAWRTEMQEQ